jgi:TfoX/Sxy family transcriptional regulator of competence genes
MATQARTVDYLLGQLAGVDGVSARKMFGEYGLFRDGKTVALVCDDQLFVKPTAQGRALAQGASEAAPYPGAKPSLLIDPERWEDADWLSELIRATADALPTPPPKRRKTEQAGR